MTCSVVTPFKSAEALRPSSFREVHRFLVKQSHRPFIKRYLQRDEIQRALGACHSGLTDALGMFNVRTIPSQWNPTLAYILSFRPRSRSVS